MNESKACKVCFKDKPLEEFYRNKKAKDGRDHRCIECDRPRLEERRRLLPEIHKAYGIKRRLEKADEIAAYVKQYRKDYPLKATVIRNRYRAGQAGVPSTVTEQDLMEIIALYGWKCMSCGTEKKISWDHIHPLSTGGWDSPDNLQLLCVSHNSGKRDKTIDYRPEFPGFGYVDEDAI